MSSDLENPAVSPRNDKEIQGVKSVLLEVSLKPYLLVQNEFTLIF